MRLRKLKGVQEEGPWLIGLIIAEVVSLGAFFLGFFPTHPASTGQGSRNQSEEFLLPYLGSSCNRSWLQHNLWTPRASRVVFFVVDALRADFALGRDTDTGFEPDHTMRNLATAVSHGHALTFNAHTQAPTVTMPRIKAITTGSVPSFIDLLGNLNSPELTLDSWLHQMRLAGKRLWFFGDDTWLSLFPQTFEKSEGTTSFFVSDYTQVDDNVSRHLPDVLAGDWDTVILHYLGLDHIGHAFGSRHPLIRKKLVEMDSVLGTLWNGLNSSSPDQDWIIVLLGDHGMSDLGSHGGATVNETSVPIVIFSPLLNTTKLTRELWQHRRMEQIDIVPLLSAFLGLPNPAPNLGTIPLSASQCFLKPASALLRHALAFAEAGAKGLHPIDNVLSKFSAHLQKATEDLCTGKITDFSDDKFYKLLYTLDFYTNHLRNELMTSNVTYHNAFLLMGSICSVMPLPWSYSSPPWRSLLVAGISAVAMCSTSYIEEEHQLWFFIFPVLALLHVLLAVEAPPRHLETKAVRQATKTAKTAKKTMWGWDWWRQVFIGGRFALLILLLVLHRIARSWHSGGDKWAHLPDFTDFLTDPQNSWLLHPLSTWSLIGVGVVEIFKPPTLVHKVIYSNLLFVPGMFAAFLHHTKFSDASMIAAGGGSALIAYAFAFCLLAQRNFRRAALVLFALQLKFLHLPLLFLLQLQARILTALNPGPALRYAFAAATFYYFGNSNSLASVDLAAGLKGFSFFNPYISGPLVILHTYAGPILALLHLPRREIQAGVPRTLALIRLTPQIFLLSVTTFHRNHLFIWSVFAPKVLYEMAHTAFLCSALVFSYYFLAKPHTD